MAPSHLLEAPCLQRGSNRNARVESGKPMLCQLLLECAENEGGEEDEHEKGNLAPYRSHASDKLGAGITQDINFTLLGLSSSTLGNSTKASSASSIVSSSPLRPAAVAFR